MTVYIKQVAFNPLHELEQHALTLENGSYGATANFIGTARDFNDDKTVSSLTLEHYPGMTEKELERIVEQAKQRWDIIDALIIHRVGEIKCGEPIVLTAAWAAHREPAFAACRFLIETLKTDAPFWKHEKLADGSRWVEKNHIQGNSD